MENKLIKLNRITQDDIKEVPTGFYVGEYPHAFIRVKRINDMLLLKDDFKLSLKRLYEAKKSLVLIKHLISNKVLEHIEDKIKRFVKALTVLAYIKRGDWDNVGICTTCKGTGYSSYNVICDCKAFTIIEGWELAHDLEYRDYEYALLNTEYIINLLRRHK